MPAMQPGSTSGGLIVQLSARNQLKGQVVKVKSGSVMAEVEVKVRAGKVVAAITDGSLRRLKLKAGDRVTVIIKATEVLIGK
jgi:molybdate transport system regulatory protein